MTTTVGYAALQIIPSTAGFGTALRGQVTPQMGGAGAAASQSFGSRFVGGLKAVAGPAAAILSAAAIGKFVTGSISAASDLNESLNAINVTFGKNAEGIKALGEEAATSLGLSNNEFNSLAVRFSNFAKTIAGPGGDVAGTMDTLTTRAADFASVMNLDVNEAAQLFQSGLAGESEPLRRYGIDMSAAAVEAFALKNGIGEAGVALTEQEKVLARNGILMQETKKTAGDFANTSGGLANATRIAKAAFTDLQASLGKALLPMLSAVMSFIAQKVIPAIQSFFDSLKSGDFSVVTNAVKAFGQAIGAVIGWLTSANPVADALRSTIVVLGAAFLAYKTTMLIVGAATKAWAIIQGVVAVATNAWAIAQFALNVAMAANPIGVIVVAIALLVAAIVIAYRHSETFRTIVQAVWAGIKAAFSAAIGFIVPLVQQAWAAILTAFNWLRTNIWPLVQKYLALIATVFRTYVKVWWTVVKAAWTVIVTVIKVAVKVIWAYIKVAWKVVSTIFKVAWKIISTIVKVAWTLIKTYVQIGIKVIMAIIHTIQAIVGFIKGVWDAVVGAFRSAIDRVMGFVRGFVDKILAVFDFVKKMYDAAADLIGGFVQGIKDKAGEILTAIKEFITDKIPGWLKGPLQIGSPSKLTYQYGKWIAEGLALGIEYGARDVEKATKKLAEAVQVRDELKKAAEDGSKAAVEAWHEAQKAVQEARKELGQAEVAQQRALNQQMQELQDQAISIAQKAVDRIKAQGAAALSFAKGLAESVRSFGALTANTEGVMTGESVIADLASKVAAAKQFGAYLIRLKRLGLNNASLQQIIAAGPIDGSQIAKALLTSGEAAIRQVNTLESQLTRAARTVGDVGVRSEFGMSTAQAQAQAGAKLEVNKDAVKITFNGDPGKGVQKEVADAVDDAFDRIMDKWERKVARDARSRQRR